MGCGLALRLRPIVKATLHSSEIRPGADTDSEAQMAHMTRVVVQTENARLDNGRSTDSETPNEDIHRVCIAITLR